MCLNKPKIRWDIYLKDNNLKQTSEKYLKTSVLCLELRLLFINLGAVSCLLWALPNNNNNKSLHHSLHYTSAGECNLALYTVMR